MAKKRPTPLLTHTAILCLALRCCERDIRDVETKWYASPETVEITTQEPRERLEILKELYRIETGTEY